MSGLPSRLRNFFSRPAPTPPAAEQPPPPDLFGTRPPSRPLAPPPPPPPPPTPEPATLPAAATWRACTIVPAAGGLLSASGGTLAIASTAAPEDAIFAIVPDAAPNLCFLLANSGQPIRIDADPIVAPALSARILPTDTRGAIRLRYPLGATAFLTCAGIASTGATIGFQGDGNTLAAVFGLAPADPETLSPAARAIAGELALAASGGLRAEPLLALLQAGRLRPGLAEPLIRILPEDELSDLARRLLASPGAMALLGRAMPTDRWVTEMLPALAAWQGPRPDVANHTTACPATDEAILLPPSGTGLLIPAGLAVHALARRQILPRRTACIIAAARNEGPYLLDWLAYHRAIGFEHVFLYTNENEDGSDELLTLLARAGEITLIENERTHAIGPQLKGYTHALTMMPQTLDFRWAALLDIDEYIGFDSTVFDDFPAYLATQETQRVDAIALCWLMFAAAPEEGWSDAGTPARFTRRERAVHELVKSLIRPNRFWYSQPHFPTATLDAPFDYRSADGGIHHHPYITGRGPAQAGAPSAEQAWINHYMLRTAQEALWKWSRGRGDLATASPDRMRPLDFIATSFLGMARPEHQVQDRRLLACAAGQGAELERLLALPGVAAADAGIKARFANLLHTNAVTFAESVLTDASPAVLHFQEIIREGLVA